MNRSFPLVKFDMVSCAFRGNTGQVGAMIGSAVFLVGTGAGEVAAMAAKPSLDSVSFIENVAQTGASGFQYDVADAAPLVRNVRFSSWRFGEWRFLTGVCCVCAGGPIAQQCVHVGEPAIRSGGQRYAVANALRFWRSDGFD